MKTLKFLKLSILLQLVFYVICAASVLCFYFESNQIGRLLSYFCILNPIGPICLAIGLIFTFIERKSPEFKNLIRNKWVWFIILFVVTSCVYVVTGGLIVILTGGV